MERAARGDMSEEDIDFGGAVPCTTNTVVGLYPPAMTFTSNDRNKPPRFLETLCAALYTSHITVR